MYYHSLPAFSAYRLNATATEKRGREKQKPQGVRFWPSKKSERKKRDEEKIINGKFRFDQDSKRFHRFRVETEVGIVGTIYISKDKKSMPKKITLEYANKEN